PDGRRYGQCCHEPIEHPFRIDTNSGKDIVFDHDASGLGTKMPMAPRPRIEFQMHGMVTVAGAACQDAYQLSRRERTNLRQKFHCFRRITAQGVSFETVDAHLDEIAQKVNGVSQDYATAAIAFLISPQSARY